MMMNRRLIDMVSESKKYVAANVIFQWFSLISNIAMIFSITALLELLFKKHADETIFIRTILLVLCAIVVRSVCTLGASRMGYLSSKTVKKVLRDKIYKKLLKLGASYKAQVMTSEVVQVAVEGVDQLETYFGAYLPQFFYSMLAPLTLFIVLAFINLPAAVVLLVCVPLIPAAIAVVQTWAKKLLAKYWGQYTALGDTFLENLQGLTTLKIYQTDEMKQQEMNRESEKFRKITMKVLTMQLNSIVIMDVVAYGGAALGIVLAVSQFAKGNVGLAGCLSIILLSSDFFIPMRQLGSFFHIAMNGMAASDKIFKLLDLPEIEDGTEILSEGAKGFSLCDVCFSYEEDREVLKDISFEVPKGGFAAIVGKSGCGKSTIAGILTGKNRNFSGTVTIGDLPLKDIKEASFMENITYIGHNSYLFAGTVRENLRMGNPEAAYERLWEVLEQVRLSDFLKKENGLDTAVLEKGTNFSGGQCQRMALSRALLKDSSIYIFDEATSNIDIESENNIMKQIHLLKGRKTILLISHRLENVKEADCIYVMSEGKIVERGTHAELLGKTGDSQITGRKTADMDDDAGRKTSLYRELWKTQQSLENYGKEGYRNEQ